MRKLIYLLVLILIFLVGCSENTDSTASKDGGNGEVKIIQGSWFPPADPIVDRVIEWEELVNEKTNGEVMVESFHGSQLGQSQTVLQDIAGGVYDLGWVSPILFDDTEMFVFTIANLPFALPDPGTGAKVMTKFLEKYSDVETVTPLGITISDPFILMSKEPIKSIDDIKGKRIRAESAVQIDLVKSWGGTPVPTPLTDMYEALEKGTLDGVIFSLLGGVSYNILEVAPNVTYLPISSIPLLPSINNETLNEMSENSKELFGSELGPAYADMYTQNNVENLEIYIEKVKEGDGEFITLSEEEMKPFQSEVKQIWDDWVEEANAKGFPGDEMMEDFKAIMKEEGIALPFE